MSPSLSLLDILILSLYVAGIVGLGSFFFRKNQSTENYTAASRSLPGWVVGLSILGTYVSSISFLALPGKSFASNWNPFVFSLSLPLAAWMASRFFVPLYRKNKDISAYTYLEKRFGIWARSYASICYLLTQLARMGAIMFLVAITLNSLLGWHIIPIILVTGILVTLYTFLGGIEAVIWTDVVQSLVLTTGALTCAILLLIKIPEGPGQVFSIGTAHSKFSLGTFSFDLDAPTFWVVLIYGIVINLQNFGIDQNYIQRYLTAKSEKEARKSVLFGSLLYIPISFLFIFIGTELFSFYTAQPHLLPKHLSTAGMADKVFPYFIVTQLPAGITGLLIAAIFAAAMSTVDSSLNSSSTVILTDFYRRYFNPNSSERQNMRVLRLSTLIWGLLGTTIAVTMINVSSVLDAWWQLSGIFSGGMLGLFLLGYFSKRVKNIAAAIATSIGILTILWMTVSPQLTGQFASLRSPFHGFLIPVMGTMVIFLLGLAISRIPIRPAKPDSAKNT